MEELEKIGGEAYYPELDLVITIKGMKTPMMHPGCRDEEAKRMFGNLHSPDDFTVSCSILIVNNKGLIGKRYTRLNGVDVEVIPTKNENLKCGAYMWVGSNKDKEMIHVLPADFKDVGLHVSMEDLLNADKELAKIEAENTRLKMEAKREETELALKKARREDYFDERSSTRKDSSESVKFLPAIIVGIGAIFMAFKSYAGFL